MLDFPGKSEENLSNRVRDSLFGYRGVTEHQIQRNKKIKPNQKKTQNKNPTPKHILSEH